MNIEVPEAATAAAATPPPIAPHAHRELAKRRRRTFTIYTTPPTKRKRSRDTRKEIRPTCVDRAVRSRRGLWANFYAAMRHRDRTGIVCARKVSLRWFVGFRLGGALFLV